MTAVHVPRCPGLERPERSVPRLPLERLDAHCHLLSQGSSRDSAQPSSGVTQPRGRLSPVQLSTSGRGSLRLLSSGLPQRCPSAGRGCPPQGPRGSLVLALPTMARCVFLVPGTHCQWSPDAACPQGLPLPHPVAGGPAELGPSLAGCGSCSSTPQAHPSLPNG